MSLKKWKLVLASLSVAMFTACAGSSNSSSDTGSYTGSNESSSESSSYTGYNDNQSEAAKPAAPVKKEPPKEVINESTLKKTQEEASAANEDNHKLRKEIFEARTKLGLPIQQPSTDAE